MTNRSRRLYLAISSALSLFSISASGTLVPFVLPWDDASSGPTNVSFLLDAPAGKSGWILPTQDGHLATNDGRIKLWGVNIVASACFPTHPEADAVAGRMAKFGFNCARFHHLEQTWETPTILDYSTGGSRTMNATSLDSLHYFSAALKAQGIYWNYNLLVARRFSAADGLPAAIDTLDWSIQRGVSFIRQDMIALQKEYATQLLTTVNPYTGLAPANDPALAVVEISNENGLIQSWMASAVDTWPELFQNDLKTLWNAWLLNRYGTDAAMQTAWAVVDEPTGSEMLTNGSFTNGATSWYLEQHETAVATATTGTYSARAGVRIQTTTASTQSWHVQFGQSGLALEEDRVYTLSYWARSDSPISVYMNAGYAHDPWSALFNVTRSLTTTWQYFETVFQSNVTDSNMRIVLGGTGATVSSVYLSDVSLHLGGNNAGLPDGASMSLGTIPILRRDTTYPTQEYSDWCRFLTETETAYWVEMKRYIREDIGYPGVIVGTIISTSSPNIQSNMDAIDSHTYWQHPVFPNTEWSSTDWTVSNVSMINAKSGVLGSLASQRVKGKPFFVTEYQHPAPNTYSSEAPLMVSAYASLQDWDGVFFFQYGNISHDWNRGYFSGFFDIDQHPTKMANAMAGALIFLRSDVSPAINESVMKFDPETELTAMCDSGSAWAIANGALIGLDDATSLINRVSLSTGTSATGLTTAPTAPSASLPYVSDTGELTWNRTNTAAGKLIIDTPRTKSLLGFTDATAFDFGGDIRITPGTTEQGWSTITISATTGSIENLKPGTKLIIVTTGNIANTGMIWTSAAHVSVSDDWGRTPSLVERIDGSIQLPVSSDKIRWWALDDEGQRQTELSVTSGPTTSTSVLQLGTADTMWYEVELRAGVEYDNWAATYFTTEQLADDAVAGFAADPDGDGYSNWQERAFELNPTTHDSPFVNDANLPPIIDGASGKEFVFYIKNAGISSITIVGEQSSDLVNWQPITLETVADARFTSLLRAVVPDSSAPIFIRVRAY